MRLGRLLLLLLLAIGVIWGCNQSPIASSEEERMVPDATSTPTGLRFRLTEGSEAGGAQKRPPQAAARPLDGGVVQSLLKRLPALKELPDQKQDFALRESSLPAPRAGKTEKVPFPPPEKPEAAPKVPTGPLEVLRYAPEGEVSVVPQVSVTFSQPMVAVTSHADTIAGGVPVKLTPEPPGNWRWIGTQTLLFEPRGEVSQGHTLHRFPKSTEYTVEIPAGTKSASGNTLPQARRFTFKTPTATLESYHPSGGPYGLDPVMYVQFDQDVDPRAVLATTRLSPDMPLVMADAKEAEKLGLDPKSKRWVAFKPAQRLQPATSYTVTVGPGTPSLEGPLKTTSPQTFSFRTYDPFRIEESRCGWNEDCRPLYPFYIRFNNPIDEEKFDPETMIKVEPAIPGQKIEVSGSVLWVRGQTRGRTRYTVRMAANLPDAFGQTLGKEEAREFNVGNAEPNLMSLGGQFVTLDPYSRPFYPVFAINYPRLRVRLWQVGPEDWSAYKKSLREMRADKPYNPPGKQVQDTVIDTKGQPDEMTEVPISLDAGLENGKGMVIVMVEPQPQRTPYPLRLVAWVQATQIGLDAAVDSETMVAWANSLRDGSSLNGVQLTLGGKSLASGGDGTARIALPAESANVLVGRQGDDVAILPRDMDYWGESGWYRVGRSNSLRWYTFDDRQMYRPDEEVRLKGWLRVVQAGPRGDIGGVSSGTVKWRMNDSRGNEILKGETPLSQTGGFDLKLKLPKTMNLGHSYIYFDATAMGLSGSHSHTIQVQEFRRPEFEVGASSSPETSMVGESATMEVKASYYAGGALANAPVNWTVSTSAGSYTPPGRGDYTFGFWTPWWESWDSPFQPGETRSFEGKTDSAGVHRIQLHFDSVEPPRPTVVNGSASVQDVNRQAWGASTSVLVHPGNAYVGLKTPRSFVEKGQPIELEVLVCDTQGKALSGLPVSMRAWRQDYTYKKGRYQEVEANVQTQEATSLGDQVIKWSINTPEGGTYRIRVRTHDSKGRPNQSEMTVWVSGGKTLPQRDLEQEKVTLVPDRKEYRPGETAQILVQSPFYPAEGLMTLRRSGLLATERFQLTGPSTVLKVPIESAHIPNLYFQVDLVGAAPRDPEKSDLKRPAYATGQLNLSVPPYERTLKVEVKPGRAALEPGVDTTVDLKVTDSNGQPVAGAEVALVVVDEAVLALSGYTIADPLSIFYANRGPDVSDHHSRASVLLVDLEQLQQQAENTRQEMDMMAPGSGAMPPAPAAEAAPMDEERADKPKASRRAKNGKDDSPVKMRTNFDALALFAPGVKTDAQGFSRVPFKLPDNLTRYRIMAVAVAGEKHFGKGESSLTARLPVMVRPSPPRFLNFGDRAELPVVVQNQTEKPMEVQVVMRGLNIKFDQGGSRGDSPPQNGVGRVFNVPANDRVEVRFPVSTDSAGTASFQVGVFSESFSDAAEFKFPVWTPATTEAFATYGTLDEGAVAQPVQAPKDVWTQFGGLELTTTSTALQELTDAVIYLVTYPYECAEQISSRVLGIVALKDVLAAFDTKELPSPQALKDSVKADMERLKGMQRYDGGFGFWTSLDGEEWPWISVHVTHTLVRAKLKGFAVPDDMLSRALDYVVDIEDHIPGWYSPEARRAVIAYALYTRNLNGDKDVARAQGLIKEAGGVDKMPLEAIGFLLPVLSGKAPAEIAAIHKHLNNRVSETAGAANFVQSYGEQGPHVLLSSDRRVDAILLDGLIVDQPKNDLIPKLVRGLLNHRKQGRWLNTQENVFVLLALDRYFQTYEKQTPDFVLRVWLGDQYAGEQKFVGRSADRRALNVPMSMLAGKGKQDLILSKQGVGRLYYRLGMSYAPKDLKLDPADHGFVVERRYEAVDDPKDVTRGADGVWHFRAGARVRVRLTMAVPSRRYHVALVDPMPAGIEAMNPALAVTGDIPADPKEREGNRYWWWYGTWYEHQNMRDERVEAFSSLVWDGVYDYSYVARATTPGEFVVPPPKAEEMYAPETFGRGASDRVIVK